MKKCVQLMRAPKDTVLFGTEVTLSDFEQRIRTDIDFIQGVLGEITIEPLRFKLITSKEKPLFVFSFPWSTPFSKVDVEVMAQLFNILVHEGTVDDCNIEDHQGHAFLLPFFCDNKRLQRLQRVNDVEILQNELAAAEKEKAPFLVNTPFTVGAHPNGATWAEDIWTRRLGNALTRYVGSGWNVTLGMDANFEDIQTLCSSLSLVSSKEFYLFHGKPDILLQQMHDEHTAVIGVSENTSRNENEADGETETVVIENKKKELTMTQMQECVVPKVLGQLLSTLHFLLATKTMAIQGDCREITAKGLLIQKSVGCYHCNMRLTLTNDIYIPEFMILSPDDTSPVTCQSLCANLNLLCKKGHVYP